MNDNPGAKGRNRGPDSNAAESARPSQSLRNTSQSLRTHGVGQDVSPRSSTGVDGILIVTAKHTGQRADRSPTFWNREAKALIQARLETSPQLLQAIVEFASVYAKHRFHSRAAEKVTLASHELLENAIAYGSVSVDVIYTLGLLDDCIEICVTNSSSLARLNNLRTHLERLRLDPEKVFYEEMARSITGTGIRAALGLARICHEGQMDLGLSVEGGQVTLRAWCWR